MDNIIAQMAQQFAENYCDLETLIEQYRDDGEDDSFILDVTLMALKRLNNENGE